MDEEKFSRVLVRVLQVERELVIVCVPAWDPRELITLKTRDVPIFVKLTKPITRFHVKVNVGANKKEDLIFKDWEPN